MEAMKAATPTNSADRLKSPDTSRSDVEPGSKRSGNKVGKSTPTGPKEGQPLVTARGNDSDKKIALLSPSSQPPKSSASTPDPLRTRMPDSPYKSAPASPAASTVEPASAELASLRHYLQTLQPDNLANTIFRDQTNVSRCHFPTTWIKQVQGSLKQTVDELMAAILAAAPPEALPALHPPLTDSEAFDWSGFGKLCSTLWECYARLALSMQALPRLTEGLLAELADELQRIPGFLALAAEKRERVLAEALFSVLAWNGMLSPLMKVAPETHKRLLNLVCIYIKAAHGLTSTTQGESGKQIVSMVEASHKEQCATFQQALIRQVRHLAGLRTVHAHDGHVDQRLNKLRESHMDRYFTGTWLTRSDDYAKQLRRGSYFLTGEDGKTRRCQSYDALRDYVGPGSRGTLPEVVLHVAGARISNFLCHTYLYDLDRPFFTDSNGGKVDPVPNLKARFTLNRNVAGVITVRYCCFDDAVARAMLEVNDLDFEGMPLFPASITFNGEIRFHPNEEFESGEVDIDGLNLHLFE